MRDVAIVSFAQSEPHQRSVEKVNEVEMLMPVTRAALDQVDLTIQDIGFTCSGSTDYLAGMGFSFVSTLDGVGPWPPIQESHVEMDGAWALYEAWVKLQIGEIDTAFVYAYSKSSPGDLPIVLTRQLDPYTAGPLWPDSVSIAALQAQAALDAGIVTREAMAEVAARSRRTRWPTTRTPNCASTARRPTWRPSPTTSACCAAPTARPSPTVPRPSCWPPATGPESCPTAPRGSVASTTASTRWPSGCATSPTCRPPAPRPRRPASPTPPSTCGSCTLLVGERRVQLGDVDRAVADAGLLAGERGGRRGR